MHRTKAIPTTQAPTSKLLGLEQLPTDILELVAKQLPIETQLSLRTCSKRLRDAIDSFETHNTFQRVVRGDESTYFLDSLGRVFGCGANTFEQLGLGDATDRSVPTRIPPAPFEGQTLTQVITHHDSSFFFSQNGQVFACGRNESGQLGVGDTHDRSVPTLINPARFGGQAITQIISDGFSSFFLSQHGQVFACGNNSRGRLGLGDKADRWVPTLINPDCFEGQAIIQVISHDGSSFFLSQDGQIFACGRNNFGRLGLGDKADRWVPTLINPARFGGQAITQIISHDGSSFFLSQDGQIFACGDNKDGQLGLGDKADRSVPTLINPALFQGQAITQIISHGGSSFFLNQHGQIFACGDNKDGQLGLGDKADRSVPTLINPALFQGQAITQIISHGGSSFFLSQHGQIFACGNNNFGQLGLGDTVDCSVPTRINPALFQGQAITQIISDGYSSFFLSQDGQIFACGHNKDGQLGLGDTVDRSVPTRLCLSTAILDLKTQRNALIKQAQLLNSLDPAVEQQGQDGSKSTKPLGVVVTDILNAHGSEASRPRGLLKSLEAIQKACPEDPILKTIKLPMQPIEQSSTNEVTQAGTRTNPFLFAACQATLTALETAEQQLQTRVARQAHYGN